MKRKATGQSVACELLILADGTVLAQNLTEQVAAILSQVAPDDRLLRQRARGAAQRGRAANEEPKFESAES